MPLYRARLYSARCTFKKDPGRARQNSLPIVSVVVWKSCVYSARGCRRGQAREQETSPKSYRDIRQLQQEHTSPNLERRIKEIDLCRSIFTNSWNFAYHIAKSGIVNFLQWTQNQNRSNPSSKGNVLDPKYLAATSCTQKICPSEPSESEMHEIGITQALNGTQLYTKLSSHETYVHRQICLVQQCLHSNPLSPCRGQSLGESLKNVPH